LIFYIYFVSTKPTALPLCVTVTSQVANFITFQISRSTGVSVATAFQDPQAYLTTALGLG